MNSRILLALLLLAVASFGLGDRRAAAHNISSTIRSTPAPRVVIHAAGRGNPYINFEDGVEIRADYTGPVELRNLLTQNVAEPRALASADFDEDGMPDLICGYARSGGGIITLYRGNVDSIFPNSPEAQRRRAYGTFTDSAFLSPARVFDAPVATDFVGAGDFDADGHWDVVIAARGGKKLYLLSGDGKGGFLAARKIALPGGVSSLVTGEINRADGLTDVVVGVVADDGPKVLIFEGPEGALKATPEVFTVAREPKALALGQFDHDSSMDLAVGAGSELVIIRGRDRKLSIGEVRGAGVLAAKVYKRSFGFEIESIVEGDFTGKGESALALLAGDGTTYLIPVRGHEKNQIATTGSKKARKNEVISQRRGTAQLVRARVSTGPGDDLLVLDRDRREVQILRSGLAATSPAPLYKIDSLSEKINLDSEPRAVLSMRLNPDAIDDLVVLGGPSHEIAVVKTSAAMTLTVNKSDDHDDGSCDSGDCTLREAINASNKNPGLDNITFNIPGAGVHTIFPNADLPQITDSTTIDGTTQPGFAGTPVIELKGADMPGFFGELGLSVLASNNTIRGLVLNRWGKPLGMGSNGNRIEGNFIGTDVTGEVATGNDDFGVFINGNGNIVGGTTTAARNLLSGNRRVGLSIEGGTGNQVQGNLIGTDLTGTVSLGNGEEGVEIRSSGNVVGGTTASARNLISGNGSGIVMPNVFRDEAHSNQVQGNFIGTDLSGNARLGNSQYGVLILTDASAVKSPGNNLVGGTVPGARNVISANEIGIACVNTDGNTVQGNFIGTGIDGITPLGNTLQGVQIFDSSDNRIGGAGSSAGNTIAYAGSDGVHVAGSTSVRNAISSNTIFSNGLLGIDLGDDGVLPNDLCDADAGANALQNFPSLTSALASGLALTIQGSLNSTPSSVFRVEFFSNAECDPSGFGEGEKFIGSTTVSTGANCMATFNAVLPAVAVGRFLTATATDAAGNTSEFSQCVQVMQGPTTFDLCLQDDSNGNILVLNSTTGEYQFSNCKGVSLSGVGSLLKKGCLVTLQVNGPDRRIQVRLDTCSKLGSASIQLLSQGTNYTITDRNTSNDTCVCAGPN